MAGIRSAVNLYDGMTPTLRNISNTMNAVISSFHSLDMATKDPINSAVLADAREQLVDIDSQITLVEQSLDKTKNSQDKFNNSIRDANASAGGLERTISRLAMTAAAAFSVGKVAELSDSMTSATARLNLMNDGLQTTVELQEKIFKASEDSRADYLATTSTVAKLGILAGDAFTSNDQMIRFVELMNKNFVVGGASSQEQSSAMYQLTQALASGRLQGDEYRSIIENAPLLAQSIRDYMEDAGFEGTMKDWASEGLLTADVIKNALFATADEVESRFEDMPMTWSQVATSMKNQAIIEFQPILQRINEIANSNRFEQFSDAAIGAIGNIADVLLDVFEWIENIAIFCQDNWDDIGPVVYSIVAAYVAWEAATKAVAIAHALMNPVSGKIAAIALAVGGATYAYSRWKNATQDTSDVLDDINERLSEQSAFIAAEKVETLMEQYKKLQENTQLTTEDHDKMNLIITEMERTIPGLSEQIRTETGYIDDLSVALENAANKFVDLAKAQAYYNVYSDKLEQAVKDKVALEESLALAKQEAIESKGKITFFPKATWNWDGKNLPLNPESAEETANRKVTELESKLTEQDNLINNFADLMLQYKSDSSSYDDTFGNNNQKLVDNTDRLVDVVEATLVDDVKYIRDMAERDAINRITTPEITVNLGGVSNTINNNQDLDGVVEYITGAVQEQLQIVADDYNGDM